MKHMKTIFALGILVALVPYLGFPSSWKGIILAALGLVIAAIAFRLSSTAGNASQKKEDTRDEVSKTTLHHTETTVVAHE